MPRLAAELVVLNGEDVHQAGECLDLGLLSLVLLDQLGQSLLGLPELSYVGVGAGDVRAVGLATVQAGGLALRVAAGMAERFGPVVVAEQKCLLVLEDVQGRVGQQVVGLTNGGDETAEAVVFLGGGVDQTPRGGARDALAVLDGLVDLAELLGDVAGGFEVEQVVDAAARARLTVESGSWNCPNGLVSRAASGPAGWQSVLVLTGPWGRCVLRVGPTRARAACRLSS
ncbi:hypothetical protein ABZ826_38550 [Streptomyces sp. NPDC047515]|uniref:hypothetical protein n=1 Tax=Streptomyces sp. NPDC047515 TaxID=3155380 RepID=UPI0033D83643